MITLKNTIIFLFLLLFCFGFIFESIPVWDGLGWDGSIYYNISKSGLSQFTDFKISGYYFFRSLPFFLFNFIPVEKSVQSFLLYMNIVNFVAILISVFYFFKIMNFFNVSDNLSISCFILLFFNFPILKLVSYYPALTDHLSFFLSILGFYYFLIKNKLVSTLIIFISLFTFPSLAIILLTLNLFNSDSSNAIDVRLHKIINILIVVFLFVVTALMINSIYGLTSISNITRQLLPLSSSLLLMYVIFIGYVFVKSEKFYSVPSLYYTSLAIIIVSILFTVFQNYPPPPKTSLSLIGFANASMKYPLNFLAFHNFYYGLVFIFILLFIKKVFSNTFRFGLGAYFVVVFFLLFIIQSESRTFINILPLIVFILVSDLKFIKISKINILIFLFISLINSRFYYKINKVPNMWDLMRKENIRNDFPVQGFFMNMGPWVSFNMYLIQIIFFITIFLTFYLILKKKITR